MQCYSCGGEMERIKKDIEANWKGRQMIFRGLHAWVCRSCGEQVYEPEDVRLMQNLMRSVEADDDYPEIMNVQEVADLLRVSNMRRLPAFRPQARLLHILVDLEAETSRLRRGNCLRIGQLRWSDASSRPQP